MLQNRVIFGPETITNTSAYDCPGTMYGRDDAFDRAAFRDRLKIELKRVSPLEMEMDMVGVDASIANALRRIMMAEVPTIAIEHVFIHENNTVMPDEVLAMRLGHVPIHFPAFRLDDPPTNNEFTENDSLVFQLRTVCRRNPAHRDTKTTTPLHPKERYLNSDLTSAMLVWKPEGNQVTHLPQAREEQSVDFEANRRLKQHFKSFWEQRKQQYIDAVQTHLQQTEQHDPERLPLTLETCVPFPVHSDIVLNKMRPRQVLSVDMIAVKGIGRDHAKFTPVSVASYRLLPDIIIKEPITGEDATKFKTCFNEGVIEVKPNTQGQLQAYVSDARRCTMSRECYRHPEFKDKVLLTRVRDHFIFHVESLGQYESPTDIFAAAIREMGHKADQLLQDLEKLTTKHTATTSLANTDMEMSGR